MLLVLIVPPPPLCERMQLGVPGIGFSKGFPTDLEDWYLNKAISDVIVVDDQMAETATCSIHKRPSSKPRCSRIFSTKEKSAEQWVLTVTISSYSI